MPQAKDTKAPVDGVQEQQIVQEFDQFWFDYSVDHQERY